MLMYTGGTLLTRSVRFSYVEMHVASEVTVWKACHEHQTMHVQRVTDILIVILTSEKRTERMENLFPA